MTHLTTRPRTCTIEMDSNWRFARWKGRSEVARAICPWDAHVLKQVWYKFNSRAFVSHPHWITLWITRRDHLEVKTGPILSMKGRAIKAPPRKQVDPPKPAGLVPKSKSKGVESHEEGTRGEVEIHRTGPDGEVNILRLDSHGDTMLLEVQRVLGVYGC